MLSINAQITHFLHINFPEDLAEEVWWFKAEQYMLLNDKDFLPTKIQYKSSKKKETEIEENAEQSD